jgi:BirA family biotin operon repressor/biotin-[acetyl-CoA-carboxylase] ligase
LIAWRLEQYEELASTSDFCAERAKAGEPEGLAVFAAQQSAGRGSRGRTWLSPPGNVALSVLLRPETAAALARHGRERGHPRLSLSSSDSSIIPLLAGVAVADALKIFCPPNITPMLKWPNDVLLNGQKCAGLLIDATQSQNRIDWLVIGIGINVAYAPEVSGRATTCLAAHGTETPAPALAVGRAVLDHLSAWLDTFQTSGPAKIISTWLTRAHPIGTHLEVKTAQHTATGTFAGLSPTGELLLRVENRIETFRTGEILLGTRT